MEKEFIPYEQALALKELGFDEPCLGNNWWGSDGIFNQKYNLENIIKAPTFSQAFRWFRDNHNLFFLVDSVGGKNGYFFAIMDVQSGENLEEYTDNYYTYEEAELECLKKLIEIVKDKL